MFFVPFVDVVVKLFGRVGEVDVGEHMRHLLGGVGGVLELTLGFQRRVYFRDLVLVVNIVPEFESDAN